MKDGRPEGCDSSHCPTVKNCIFYSSGYVLKSINFHKPLCLKSSCIEFVINSDKRTQKLPVCDTCKANMERNSSNRPERINLLMGIGNLSWQMATNFLHS